MPENRYFAVIPQTLSHSKQFNSLPNSARWLYVIMAVERHGVDAPFELTYKQIKEITGYSTATVSRGIKALAKEGLIKYDHGGLEKNPNVYYMEPAWLKIE